MNRTANILYLLQYTDVIKICNFSRNIFCHFVFTILRLRWSGGSVLAFVTQVRGFKPGPKPSDFSGEKILSAPSFGGEVKPSVPCRKITACKRTQK